MEDATIIVYHRTNVCFLLNKMLQKKLGIFSDVSVIFTLKRSFFKNTLTMLEKILQFPALKRMFSYKYFVQKITVYTRVSSDLAYYATLKFC